MDKADVARTDDYANALIGVGTRADRSSFSGAKAARILTQWDVENLYMADGLARKVVDLPAEEMTRSGIELEGLEDEALAEHVMSRLDELDAMRHMSDAVRISRMTGGALMIFGLNDGGALDVPLNPQGVKSVDFIRVYDRYQANIKTRVEDPALKEYGQPELWEITPVIGGAPYLVHHSRVHVFDGEFIPERKRQQNNGWGASVYQGGMDQLVRLGMGHQWANMILERSQQAIHKIPKLADTLMRPGGEAMLQKRVDVVDMVRGILNTVVVDGEEDYDVISTSLANVPDILDRFAEAVSAVFSIPVTVLMGRATGGLGSTDKGMLDAWYARVGSWWNDILRKPEDRLVTFLMMERGQNKPYKLCMRPLVVMSDKESAEVEQLQANARKVQADADAIYLDRGVIDPDEVRAGLEEQYGLAAGSLAPIPDPVEPVDGE